MLYTNRKVPIRFADGLEVSRAWLKADQSRAQRVLRKRSEQSIACSCTPLGVPMHVVSRAGKLHLATNPGRSHHHALSCPSYKPDKKTSGLRHYSKAAYSHSRARHHLQVSNTFCGTPPFTHFSPSAALQLVWELAGLTISTPKTVPARDFYKASLSIVEATRAVSINGVSMRCFVPCASEMSDDTNYVSGFVDSITTGKYANRISLKGARKTAFWVNQKSWAASNLDNALGPYEAPSASSGTCLMAKLWRSDKGNFQLYDVGTIALDTHFLPVHSTDPHLTDRLIAEGRRFFVCLRFDAPDDRRIPAAVLVDDGEPQPIALPK